MNRGYCGEGGEARNGDAKGVPKWPRAGAIGVPSNDAGPSRAEPGRRAMARLDWRRQFIALPVRSKAARRHRGITTGVNHMDEVDRLSEQIQELQGSMLAMECFVNSLTEALSDDARVVVQAFYASESAAFRTALMTSTAPEATVAAFERDVQRAIMLLGEPGTGASGA
jgi:hypothetical protein